MSRATAIRKPKPLSDAQLAALDWIVQLGQGGEAYAGHARFRDQVARSLRTRGCLVAVRGSMSILYTKWRITEKGYEERVKAHEARR